VIKNGGYTLEPAATYKNIFKGHDQESIFELYMLYSGAANEATGDAFNQFLQTPFIVDQQTSWYVVPDLIENLYGDTTSTSADIRVKANFYGLHSTTPFLIKYSDVVYQNSGSQTTAYVSDDLVILRLADIYLTRAEAAVRLGDLATGDMYLNLVRKRAGVTAYNTTNASDMIYEIMDERGREFYGEGSWYFDLYRTGLIDDPNYDNAVQGYNTDRVNGGGCEWPLGLRALLAQDPLLVQNKWWASH
jgi:starch-binding outer membrane protein, SusD/RagB family